MKRILLGLLAAVALAIGPLSGPARAKDKLEIVMSSTGFLYLAPLVAKELGYFDQEGIAANINITGGGSKAMAAIIGGDAHIYVGVPSSAFRARSKGTDVVVFGSSMTQFGSNFVMAGDWAKKHGITEKSPYEQKLKALKGMTVGVTSAGSGTDQVVRFLAREAGLDPNRDLTITALGTGDAMTAALAQGRINGFTHSSPVGENAVKNHGAIMFLNTSRGEVKALDGFFYIGFIAREPWLKKNEDLAVRFLRAMQKALDTMHDPQATTKARDAVHAAYHSKTDKELYDYTWENTLPAYPKRILITEKMIKTVVDFMNEYDKEPIDPKVVEKAWTNEYAEKAVGAGSKS